MKFSRPYQLLAGRKIRWGMFEGMTYVMQSVGSSFGPKLLGTYELELSHLIGEICDHRYSKIVDVGAAEGYYAVGLALRSDSSLIVAYEVDSVGRQLIAELASMNGVSNRVRIEGLCGIPELQNELSSDEDTFLMMDAEGAESSLLDPAKVPRLIQTDILVELHEFITPGVGALLRDRFSQTHTICEIHCRERALDDAPRVFVFASALVGRGRVLNAMNEGRPAQMSWLFLKRRELVNK